MPKLFYILLVLLCQTLFAQQKNKYSTAELEQFYNKCDAAKEDTIHRLIVGFTNKLEIRKKPKECLKFCNDFKILCTQKSNEMLYRRLELFELTCKLRFDTTSSKEGQQRFKGLFEKYLAENDKEAALESMFEMGNFLHSQKDFLGVLKTLFYAEKFAIKNNFQNKISFQGILHSIGFALWKIDKPAKSIIYFKNTLATNKTSHFDSLLAFNAIGMNYQKLNNLNQSLKYYKMASNIAIAGGDDTFNAVVMGSTAASLVKMGKLDSANYYASIYKNVSIKASLWENAVDAYYILAQIEIQRKNFSKSKVWIDSLNNLMVKIKPEDFITHKRNKEVTYQYFEAVNEPKKALDAYKEFIQFDTKLREFNNKSSISELELNVAVRLYEEEINQKEQARKWKAILTNIALVILVFGFVIIAFLGYKKIRKTEKEKHSIEEVSMQQASEIEKLKIQLLKQLAEIRNTNLKFKNSNSTYPENDLNTSIGNEAELDLLKQFNLTQKGQWQGFKDSFCKTYPDFEQNIIEKTGTISQAELRLMMLLKLGLNNNEIGKTLLITMDGVKKAKYRLYKKVGVGSSSEMFEYINQQG
jgi:DNA-binding CsgD family transcriptional regulator/tetratricopeptide (TPR) repeat protein